MFCRHALRGLFGMKLRVCALMLVTSGLLPLTSRADFNAALDFSPTGNPNGAWSYGYSTTLGGALIPYTDFGNYRNPNNTLTGLDGWWKNIGLFDPAVVHNGTAGTLTINGTAIYAPGQLGFHPGPNGENSIVRFTAPTAAVYSLTSAFTGIDTTGTTTDVHVLLNGTALFGSQVNGFGAKANFSTPLQLAIGDHLDFVVGYGANNNFGFDSTGLTATLTTSTAPEPASMFLLGMGLANLVVYSRHRRMRKANPSLTGEI